MEKGTKGPRKIGDREYIGDFDGKGIEKEDRLKAFFVEYDIARTISKAAGQNGRLDLLKFVREKTEKWSEASISQKAKALTSELPGRDLSNKSRPKYGPVSAASKLAWFMSPKTWTLYDSRASAALGVGKFDAFYQKLEDLNFVDWCNTTQKVQEIDKHGLYPERVFDKALFLLGGIDNFKKIAAPEHSCDALSFATAVVDLKESKKIHNHLKRRFGFP